jgi:poly(3-hydroxybutyrate) depolymerase
MLFKWLVASSLASVLWAAPWLAAEEEPRPGKIKTVTCKDAADQTYDCYLPTKYDASRKWPILYGFSPNANGRAFVDHYKDVCEKYGWIVVASNNARNGPWEPIKAAMEAMWKDTQARLSTHPKRCYSTGWSGGSGVAFDLARKHPERFAGVIPIAVGSGWESILPQLPAHVSVYFVIGDQDSLAYVKQQAEVLAKKGHKTEVGVFSGGHVWPPKAVVEKGVDWLESVVVRPSPGEQLAALTRLELTRKVTRRLTSAVKYAGRGQLKAALAAAERVLAAKNASEADRADAKYVRDAILERLKQMFDRADKLLAEGLPYEATLFLDEIRKAAGPEHAKRARARAREITSNPDLKTALRAGKLYNQALELAAEGKAKRAGALFRKVAKRYPETKYAKLAEEKR